MRTYLLYMFLLTMLVPSLANSTEPTRIEIIELHNRTSNEIIPLIKPLMDQNSALTGTGYELIIRATPEKLVEIKDLINQLDNPSKTLIIHVKYANESEAEVLEAEIAGRVPVGKNSEIIVGNSHDAKTEIKIMQTEKRDNGTDEYKVRVLDGNIAHIQTGKSIPVPQRSVVTNGNTVVTQDSIEYRDVTSGFYALPRLSGNIVTVDISPKKESLSQHGGGVINVQAMHTRIQGKLGEWMSLGGVNNENRSDESGIIYKTRQRNENNYQIFIKIEQDS